VALVIPLNCRDTFLRPPCCARTEEPYAGGAPPLGPGPRLSVDGAGRLVEGATTGAWRGCELNIAAIERPRRSTGTARVSRISSTASRTGAPPAPGAGRATTTAPTTSRRKESSRRPTCVRRPRTTCGLAAW
jgi:hypothetical protein